MVCGRMARFFGDAYPSVSDPFFRRALELAERGRGTASPNPLVGCVIVRDGAVVGEGWHERAGGPHAEVVALAAAGDAARGADVYVTLEPCDHHGRTPPCTEALLRAGVGRVAIGMKDPDTRVGGGGADRLLAEGVEVAFADDPSPFEALNAGWLRVLRDGRPRVRVKVALTLDGHAALREGERAAVSGPETAVMTARLRAEADVVMAGRSTVLVDDPALTVRDADGRVSEKQPLRVVLCHAGVPPADARVLTDGAGPSAVLVPEEVGPALDELERTGTRIIRYRGGDGVSGALRALADDGACDVLVEAGPRLFTLLWSEGVMDELVVYHAGGVAGPQAPPLFVESTCEGTAVERTLQAFEAGTVGGDVVTVWGRS